LMHKFLNGNVKVVQYEAVGRKLSHDPSGGLAVSTSRLRLSLETSHAKSLKACFFANQPS
jgi:hypothetical protein